MKFLIIGLGNVGEKYELTRHNIGFLILDYFSEKFKKKFLTERYGQYTWLKIKGRKVHLLKPNTLMNLSGKAVNYWMKKLKIRKENLLILVDDLNLPFGKKRVRQKGKDGGHNGLKSINESIGSSEYPRLRFGIGSKFNKGNQSNYVLDNFSKTELENIEEEINESLKIIETFCLEGVEKTMNRFN